MGWNYLQPVQRPPRTLLMISMVGLRSKYCCNQTIYPSVDREKLHIAIVDVYWSWWRHQMETFSALLAFCAGNSPVTGELPAQRPVKRSFDVFFFIWACTSSWADNEDAGDLRRHGAHYDLIVLRKSMFVWHHCDGHRLSYACDYHLAWTYSQICTFI